jgi:pilus assembly protein CpaB
MVLVLATAALGFIAYTATQPKPVAQTPAVEQKAPEPPAAKYFVAVRSLPTGTILRDEDFDVRPAQSDDAKIELRGSLVRNFVEAGRTITSQDVLRPRDRGLVASLLAPGARAISINVDMESGVSGLISPGDYVDVVWTQTSDKEDRAHHALSEILVQNVRILAIDQDIVAGDSAANAERAPTSNPAPPPPAKLARSVSLQLSPEQVKKINLAKDLGKLSLAVRSAVEVADTADAGAVVASDVSPAIACQNVIARQFTTVVVYAKGKHSEYTVRKQRIEDAERASGCAGFAEMAPASAALAGADGEKAKE